MSTPTVLQTEFEKAFLNDNFFSERIVYTVNDTDANKNKILKTISAVVYRNKLGFHSGRNMQSSKDALYDVEITISKDATKGIASVSKKIDSVKIPINYGDSVSQIFRVSHIIYQDQAVARLGLTK